MIVFENVTKNYFNGNTGIIDVSFSINEGDFVFLTGSSGSGKSTVIRLIYREILPTDGDIYIRDDSISAMRKKHVQRLRRSIGVVFQDFKLINNRTVKQNLIFALEAINFPRREIDDRVEEVLEIVELLRKQNDYPYQLSGGEQQRASIARAIINRPSIILADEPTGNLDDNLAHKVLEIFKDINKNQNTTVLFATHNRFLINLLNERVLFLHEGVLNEYKA